MMLFWLLCFQPQVSFFEHEANALNSSGPRTVIRHPLTNGDIGAILIVTNVSKPGVNSARLAVTYDLSSQRWSIENQDGSAQSEGYRYHVAVVFGPDGFRHQATAANTEFNYTYLDQPGLNGNPGARVLVTAVTSGTPNDRTLGLWYDTLQARWAIYNQDTSTNMVIGSRFNVWVVPDSLETQVVFGNGDTWVGLDGPSFNQRPEGLVFFSTQFNPPEGGGFVYSTEAQRAAYFIDRWYLDNTGGPFFPEDLALLAVGVPENEAHFRHLTSEGTLSLGDSVVVHPLLNDDGFQLPFCANEAYGTGSGFAINNSPIAMRYRTDVARWVIHNPTGGAVAADLRFHIGVPERDALSFVHIAGEDTTGGSISLLDHPGLNNNPDAVFLVQPVTRSQGFDAVPDVHEIGVVWEATTQHWALRHQDVTAFTVGSLFHIWVPKRHVWRHINTAENALGFFSTLDHPRINNNPFARILFSKNNTPEALPTMNTNPGRTSLVYVGSHWQLWNTTGVNQFLGIGYNLVYLGNDYPASWFQDLSAWRNPSLAVCGQAGPTVERFICLLNHQLDCAGCP